MANPLDLYNIYVKGELGNRGLTNEEIEEILNSSRGRDEITMSYNRGDAPSSPAKRIYYGHYAKGGYVIEFVDRDDNVLGKKKLKDIEEDGNPDPDDYMDKATELNAYRGVVYDHKGKEISDLLINEDYAKGGYTKFDEPTGEYDVVYIGGAQSGDEEIVVMDADEVINLVFEQGLHEDMGGEISIGMALHYLREAGYSIKERTKSDDLRGYAKGGETPSSSYWLERVDRGDDDNVIPEAEHIKTKKEALATFDSLVKKYGNTNDIILYHYDSEYDDDEQIKHHISLTAFKDELYGKGGMIGGKKILTYVKVIENKDKLKKGDILPVIKINSDRYNVDNSVVVHFRGENYTLELQDEMRGYEGDVEYTGYEVYAKGGEVSEEIVEEFMEKRFPHLAGSRSVRRDGSYFETWKERIERGDTRQMDNESLEVYEHLKKKYNFAKGGEVDELPIVASYDVNDYLDEQARYWKEKKDEFIEHLDLDEEEAKEVDDDYIDKHVWGDEDAGTWIYEDLQHHLEEEFSDKLGKHVIVRGRNMGWRNLHGTKTFELDDTEQMMREIVPENTDFTYYLYKTDDNNYSAKVSHHDSPMGEHYELHIMPQKYVDEFYSLWDDDEDFSEQYDEDDIGEWYQEQVLSKKGLGGFLLGSAVGGYAGYKIGRARPQKTGFATEKKIAAQVKKEIKEMQKRRAKKKKDKSNIVDVEFEEIKERGGSVGYNEEINPFILYHMGFVGEDPSYTSQTLDSVDSYSNQDLFDYFLYIKEQNERFGNNANDYGYSEFSERYDKLKEKVNRQDPLPFAKGGQAPDGKYRYIVKTYNEYGDIINRYEFYSDNPHLDGIESEYLKQCKEFDDNSNKWVDCQEVPLLDYNEQVSIDTSYNYLEWSEDSKNKDYYKRARAKGGKYETGSWDWLRSK